MTLTKLSRGAAGAGLAAVRRSRRVAVLCALGDGAASPVQSSIQYFRDEYLAHIEHQACPFGAVRELAGAH